MTDLSETPCPLCGGSLLGPKELTGATDFYTPVCPCVYEAVKADTEKQGE